MSSKKQQLDSLLQNLLPQNAKQDSEDEESDLDDSSSLFESDSEEDEENQDEEVPSQPTQSKKKNKNRPEERSTKKRVPYGVKLTVPKKKSRDPRFDAACGDLKEAHFRQNYAFIDEMKNNELNQLSKKLKKLKDPIRKKELEAEMIKQQQELKKVQRADQMRKRMEEWKKAEREKVKQGKQPYFLKKSVAKQLAIVDQYEELKKQGKLESYMAKRRKKNAAKDHRYIPYQRREVTPLQE
eukprot:TRINITY_DN12557_c0_g1_i1.p1 TRINITY_DN12557_c0_g1~~TRINITY_DN12557_c0_g1_i1.p1  ORF type:complete len:262 (-),score=68.07 TRINITY_DN12557_c0_g1_i1:18-737(-)